MSLLNGFNGQGNRPPARPAADQTQATTGQHNAGQPSWGQPQAAHPNQQPAQQWAQPSPAGYAPQNYGHAPAPNTQGHPAHAYPAQHAPSYGGLSANPDPYAPSFEPFSAPAQLAAPQRPAQQPAYQPHMPATPPPAAQGYGQQGYGLPDPRAHGVQQASHQAAPQQQWSPQQPAARGFDNYLQQPVAAPAASPYRAADPRHHEVEPSLSDWAQQGQAGQPHGNQGYDYADPNGYNEPGFAQPAGGDLEQQYADDDGQEYEVEEPSRIRRPVMIAAALAGAILVGGGLAYGYKSFLGGAPGGTPPTVKSASAPSKTKPADAGGTQFAHTDSKIMGRLGDGASPSGVPSSDASPGETDANGVRKVKPLVIGRDGSIQAPADAPAVAESASPAQPSATTPAPSVSVPGMMVVDALGPRANAGSAPAAAAPVQVAAAASAPQKLVVTPPAPAKPAVVAKAAAPTARELPEATGSIEPAQAPVVKKATTTKKVAAATVNDAFSTATGAPAAAAAPVTAATGGNGFVAVLASVPRSANSRMDALKRFADMQQKYGSVLGGKTPDVAEADLGAKGAYHRLVVGPPASREQASTLCSQLKAQGYADCWVTSY